MLKIWLNIPQLLNHALQKQICHNKEDVSVSKNGRFKSGLEIHMENSKSRNDNAKIMVNTATTLQFTSKEKQAGVMEDAHIEDQRICDYF